MKDRKTIWSVYLGWYSFMVMFPIWLAVGQQEDPLRMNGGSILAMAGDNCVAMAVDKRLGRGPQMVHTIPRTVFLPNEKVMVGFTGLEGDVQTFRSQLSLAAQDKAGRFGFFSNDDLLLSSYDADNEQHRCEISVTGTSSLISHLLYGRRRSRPFYVEPIIAGLSEDDHEEDDDDLRSSTKVRKYKPYLCSQDVIGAKSTSNAFVCAGAASKSLYGTAEALWRPGLSPEQLVQVCGKAFLSALERDCLSGYGAVLYLIVGGVGVMEYDLACRND